jgi:hypothetical protein
MVAFGCGRCVLNASCSAACREARAPGRNSGVPPAASDQAREDAIADIYRDFIHCLNSLDWPLLVKFGRCRNAPSPHPGSA